MAEVKVCKKKPNRKWVQYVPDILAGVFVVTAIGLCVFAVKNPAPDAFKAAEIAEKTADILEAGLNG